MTAIMGKEAWIKSRTGNPNKLGRNVWISLYELRSKGMQIPPESLEALKPLYMDMEREYLIKLGLPPYVTDSNWKIILGYMGNTDLDQNQEAMKMGLSVTLGLDIPAPQKPTKSPTNVPKRQSPTIDKASWIKSRTNNPDRLGLDVWEAMYDVIHAQERLPEGREFDILQKEMMKDYLTKNGLSYNNPDDPNLKKVYAHFKNLDNPQPPAWASQLYLDFVSGKLKKPTKSPIDTLKDAARKFSQNQNNKGRG